MTLQDLQSLGFQLTPDGKLFVPFTSTGYMNNREGPESGDNPNAGKYFTTDRVRVGNGEYEDQRQYYDTLDQYMSAVNNDPGFNQTPDLSNIRNEFAGTNQPSYFNYSPGLNGATGASFGDFGGTKGYFLDPQGLGSMESSPGSAWNDFRNGPLPLLLPAIGGVALNGLDAAAASATSADIGGTGSAIPAGSSVLAGGEGVNSLLGDAGTDTLGSGDVASGLDPVTMGETTGNFSGGGSDALAGSGLGGSTDNYFGDLLDPTVDPNTGFSADVPTDTTSADISGGVDQFGNPTSGDLNFSGGNTNDFFNPSGSGGIDWQGVAKKYGVTAAKYLYQQFSGSGNQRQTVGQGILGQLTGDPLGSAFSSLPFLLALNEANKQGGDINDTVGKLRGLEDQVSGNASPYMNAVLNPYDQATGTGRAALLQDQGLRGIRGSSFGDQSLNSYDYTRDVGRGDIASKALLGSTALQGNLIGSELDAITKRNTNRNLLLGAGLSASGKLFQPQQDPFNLATLLGLGGTT